MTVAWWPQSRYLLKAGVRMRCLTPLNRLIRDDVKVELYDAARESTYVSVIVQAWSVFNTAQNSLTPEDFLAQIGRLKQRGIRIVVDNCDNQFFNPNNDPAWSRQIERLRRLLSMADHLVCATDALAEVTRAQGFTQDISVVGDAVECARDLMPGESWARRHLNPMRIPAKMRLIEHAAWISCWRLRGHLPLVWFGNHGVSFAEGGMTDLSALRGRLERTHSRRPISLTVISNHPRKFSAEFSGWRFPTRYVAWDRTTFLPVLRLHDVALIPVRDNPFTRCKSSNRVATALNEGLAVAADPIPSYQPFSGMGWFNGFDEGFAEYLANRAMRANHIAAGRKHVSQHCSIAAISDAWRKVIESELHAGATRSFTAASA